MAASPPRRRKWWTTIHPASSDSSEDGARRGTEEGEELNGIEDREAPTFVIKGIGQGAKSWREAAVREESPSDAESGSADNTSGKELSIWDKVTEALGIGTWSYVTLGLSVFIILLNNTLGPGWLTRLVQGESFDGESVINMEQPRPFQVMPLDDPSNLLE